MTRESLPPQAYTKETLASAITWLQTQPEHVKSLVRTQDSLVTIYLKWKRNGAAALENLSPAYHERLRSDLKSIRAVMDQFDPNSPAPAQHPAPLAIDHAAALKSSEKCAADAPGERRGSNNSSMPTSSGNPQSWVTAETRSLPLDDESLRRVSLVRERLNLSSDHEALRVLISLGFDRLRDQLPRS